MKFDQKIQAIGLREMGQSYSEILKEIKVSRSTLSLWLRDIKLSPRQEERIYIELRQKNAYRMAQANQMKRIERIQEITSNAKQEILIFINNPLFLAGLMLYWAEGDKSERQERVKFTNSDPFMVKFMMRWFRDICKVPEEKFRVGAYIHSLHSRENIEEYWSKVTGVPRSQFYKTQIKQTTLKQRRNKLYEGTCGITISDRALFRKIMGWKLGFVDRMDALKV